MGEFTELSLDFGVDPTEATAKYAYEFVDEIWRDKKTKAAVARGLMERGCATVGAYKS